MGIETALLIALFAGIAGVDAFNGSFIIGRPVIAGPIVGLLMGDLHTGLIVGGTLELAWLGFIYVAGSIPPNTIVGAVLGTVFAIQGNLEPTSVVSLALPFAIIAQQLIVLQFTVFSTLIHKADEYCEKAQPGKIEMLHYFGLFCYVALHFVCTFFPVYYGKEIATAMTDFIPKTFMEGLSLAGGVMPALGFAVLLKMLLKAKYAAYFAIGFVAVTFLHMPILGVAIGAIAIAAIDYFNHQERGNITKVNNDSAQGGI